MPARAHNRRLRPDLLAAARATGCQACGARHRPTQGQRRHCAASCESTARTSSSSEGCERNKARICAQFARSCAKVATNGATTMPLGDSRANNVVCSRPARTCPVRKNNRPKSKLPEASAGRATEPRRTRASPLPCRRGLSLNPADEERLCRERRLGGGIVDQREGSRADRLPRTRCSADSRAPSEISPKGDPPRTLPRSQAATSKSIPTAALRTTCAASNKAAARTINRRAVTPPSTPLVRSRTPQTPFRTAFHALRTQGSSRFPCVSRGPVP